MCVCIGRIYKGIWLCYVLVEYVCNVCMYVCMYVFVCEYVYYDYVYKYISIFIWMYMYVALALVIGHVWLEGE